MSIDLKMSNVRDKVREIAIRLDQAHHLHAITEIIPEQLDRVEEAEFKRYATTVLSREMAHMICQRMVHDKKMVPRPYNMPGEGRATRLMTEAVVMPKDDYFMIQRELRELRALIGSD